MNILQFIQKTIEDNNFKVITSCGDSVEIFSIAPNDKFPIMGIVTSNATGREILHWWDADGHAHKMHSTYGYDLIPMKANITFEKIDISRLNI